jgi:predicted permease
MSNWLSELWRRVAALVRRNQIGDDLEEEMRLHMELRAQQQRESGIAPDEAQYAARRQFGNTLLLKEASREVWGWASLERFLQDLRYGLRILRKSPVFSAAAITTLGLGIGANTAMFSVVDAVLLRPLPYIHPERLVRVWQNEPKMDARRMGTAPPEFASYRDRTRAFANLAGYQWESYDLTGGREPQRIRACKATASLFRTLGTQPMIGRTFTVQDEVPGAARAVVLSYRFWSDHYAKDPSVLGSILRLDEQPYQIAGVMPESFTFPSTDASPGEPPAVWTPLSFTHDQMLDWASSFDTSIVARLRDGVGLSQARDDVRRIANAFQQEHPDIYSGNVVMDTAVEPWAADAGERLPLALSALCGVVGFVLLIACANVANLLLARAGVRQREISIRRALGATPARLMRQMFTETAILTVGGGLLGCALAEGLIHLAQEMWAGEVNLATARIDLPVLLFVLALCGLTALFCGLAPGWSAGHANLNDALKQSGRQSGPSRGTRRLIRLLVQAEVACSVVLLIGSTLLLRSFIHLIQVPLGFNPEHVLIVRTDFNRQRYGSADRRHQAAREIERRLSTLPGVTSVAVTTHIPLADERRIGFLVDGRPPDEFHWADNALVSAGYFRAMGIQLLSGRTFSPQDTPDSPLAAIINQHMAKQYWPNEDPLGKGFKWGGRHLNVVGVVADIHVGALDQPVNPAIYNSVYQIESGATTSGVFVIRTSLADPMQLRKIVQNAIWSVDREIPTVGFSTLHQVVSASLAFRRSLLELAAGFTGLALLLSLIGIYGVLSNAVTQRVPEIGVRMALGAVPGNITSLIVGEGIRLTVWGVVIGLIGGAIAGRLIATLLFDVRALDPVSLTAGVTMILVASLLASYLPARRASRLDPLDALHYE